MKKKLERFAEVGTFSNVFQKDCTLKGKWNQDYFKNHQPIVLELGCGRGEYSVALSKLFPEKNFIGVDVKGNRIWRGAKTGIEENLVNLAYLRAQIESLPDYFAENEISEIWITFPDPQPQLSREKKRLTSPRFLENYRKIVKPNSIIHLKTDNKGLYNYTLELLTQMKIIPIIYTSDLYHSDLLNELLEIKTTYESRYLREGKNITYLSFQL